MVVDDNSATRRMVRNALQRKGHQVVEAADGKTARALMASEHPRVVIQDLMLPDADGFELVGELRELARGSEVSILAFSGFVSELDEARASTVGFDDIIAKPIAPSRLVPIVEAHLPVALPTTAQFGSGRRLVIADDDPLQLKLASFRLTRLGFDVEAVGDGMSALAACRRAPPDALVSDVMMPELDGFGLAMALRKDPQLRRLPLVLVTSSYVEPADRELARRAGANDMVPRTPDLAELLEALRSTLLKPAVTSSHVEPHPEVLDDLEREHNRRVFRQLERQVMLNTGLAKRCSALASELTVLTGIAEAVLKHRDVDVALDEAVAECFDAGGIAIGALYLVHDDGLRVRPIGPNPVGEELATFYGHEELLRDAIERRITLRIPSGSVPRSIAMDLLARARATGIMLVPLVHLDAGSRSSSPPLGSLLMVARGHELEGEDWATFAHGIATQVSQVLALASAYQQHEAAEQRARQHAQLLDAVLEAAPDRVFHVGLDGTILFANRASAPEQMVGTNIFEGNDGFGTALRDAFDRVVATGQPDGFEASLIGPSGHPIWYSTRIGPITEAGKVTSVVLVSRDVSENKQTEMHLMVADRMASVGTLAAGVAHEINNPLASVIANLDMAIQDIEGVARDALPGELADELADARHAADRVREIVRDLKIFSRSEEETRGAVDVESVLDSTLRMAWNELRHRARIVKTYGKVPTVDGNESRLGQVFLNLIINAAHAIPLGNYERNQISVTTSLDARGNVVVTVADTGSGIPPEVRPRLFTPFFTTKPVGVGTGLGLAISHKIVTQYGGSLTYETEVGKGTAFRVTLPVASHPVAPLKSGPIPLTTTRRGRVLVVDDEEALAQAMRRSLAADHEVAAVHSASAALELLQAGQRYDVILCDLMMPQVTGMDLHAAIVAIDPAQADRMVFVTGGAFTPSAREFLDEIPNRRIEKPFDLKALRNLVASLVR